MTELPQDVTIFIEWSIKTFPHADAPILERIEESVLRLQRVNLVEYKKLCAILNCPYENIEYLSKSILRWWKIDKKQKEKEKEQHDDK